MYKDDPISPLRHLETSHRCKPLVARLVEADLVDHEVEPEHRGGPEGVADEGTCVHAVASKGGVCFNVTSQTKGEAKGLMLIREIQYVRLYIVKACCMG